MNNPICNPGVGIPEVTTSMISRMVFFTNNWNCVTPWWWSPTSIMKFDSYCSRLFWELYFQTRIWLCSNCWSLGMLWWWSWTTCSTHTFSHVISWKYVIDIMAMASPFSHYADVGILFLWSSILFHGSSTFILVYYSFLINPINIYICRLTTIFIFSWILKWSIRRLWCTTYLNYFYCRILRIVPTNFLAMITSFFGCSSWGNFFCWIRTTRAKEIVWNRMIICFLA